MPSWSESIMAQYVQQWRRRPRGRALQRGRVSTQPQALTSGATGVDSELDPPPLTHPHPHPHPTPPQTMSVKDISLYSIHTRHY